MSAEVRGYWLRELPEERDLMRAQLGERIGVDPNVISRIERGDLDGVRLGMLRAHAAILGVELSVSLGLGDERCWIG